MMYDMEGRGCITPLSLKLMLGKLAEYQDMVECHAMICRFHLDGDGVLSCIGLFAWVLHMLVYAIVQIFNFDIDYIRNRFML
jgi:hypothetical protein